MKSRDHMSTFLFELSIQENPLCQGVYIPKREKGVEFNAGKGEGNLIRDKRKTLLSQGNKQRIKQVKEQFQSMVLAQVKKRNQIHKKGKQFSPPILA